MDEAVPPERREEPPRSRYDIPVTLLAGALAAGLALPQLSPSRCRICDVNGVDEAAPDAL